MVGTPWGAVDCGRMDQAERVPKTHCLYSYFSYGVSVTLWVSGQIHAPLEGNVGLPF